MKSKDLSAIDDTPPIKCPHCGFVRSQEDKSPDWICPECGKPYIRYREQHPPRPQTEERYTTNTYRQRPIPQSKRNFRMILFAMAALLVLAVIFRGKTDIPVATNGPLENIEVVLYMQSTDDLSMKMEDYLQQHRIRHTVYDVLKSDAGRSQFRAFKAHETPLLLIGDTLMLGFDEVRMQRMLKQKRLWPGSAPNK